MPRIALPPVTHVVINSGYTSRILRRSVDAFEEDWPRYDDEGDEHFDKDVPMPEFLRLRGALYLQDDVWGNGVVPLGEGYAEIHKLVTESFDRNLRAHITFKITHTEEAFQIAEMLIKLGYCAWYNMAGLYDVAYAASEDQKTCVMMLSFDNESG